VLLHQPLRGVRVDEQRRPPGLLALDRHRAAGETTPGHWRLPAVEAYAGDRPLAWIDDALNDACREWAAARGAPTLLVDTDPAVGLVDEHADRLRRWAAAL